MEANSVLANVSACFSEALLSGAGDQTVPRGHLDRKRLQTENATHHSETVWCVCVCVCVCVCWGRWRESNTFFFDYPRGVTRVVPETGSNSEREVPILFGFSGRFRFRGCCGVIYG